MQESVAVIQPHAELRAGQGFDHCAFHHKLVIVFAIHTSGRFTRPFSPDAA